MGEIVCVNNESNSEKLKGIIGLLATMQRDMVSHETGITENLQRELDRTKLELQRCQSELGNRRNEFQRLRELVYKEEPDDEFNDDGITWMEYAAGLLIELEKLRQKEEPF